MPSSMLPNYLENIPSPFRKICPGGVVDDLFVAIQNIIAGTASLSTKMITETCLEWKIQLFPNTPVIFLQYELKCDRNEIVHVKPVTDNQEVDKKSETVDNTKLKHKNVITCDEIQNNSSISWNFTQELSELFTVLNDNEQLKAKQLVSFNNIEKNHTKMPSSEMNINTVSINQSIYESTSSSVEIGLIANSNKIISQLEKQNGNCGDEIQNQMPQGIVSNNRHSEDANKRMSLNQCRENMDLGDKHFTALNLLKRIHTGEKRLKCGECGISFAHTTMLFKHKRLHASEKDFKCGECGKLFLHSSDLIVHQMIHKKEKPFKCRECGISFAQSINLTVHKRIHSGEKHFKCNTCNKSFNVLCELSEHTKIHMDEHYFKCGHCGKCFGHLSNFINRKKKSHR